MNNQLSIQDIDDIEAGRKPVWAGNITHLCGLARIGAAVKPKLDEAVNYATALMAASTNDWKIAGYDEIGLHGVPIKQWREAYREGCNDMASGIIQRLGSHDPEKVKELYTKELEALSALPTPTQNSTGE